MPPDEKTLAELLARLKIKLDSDEKHFKSKRPDKHKEVVSWNDHFEREISSKYDNYAYDTPRMEDRPEAERAWKDLDIADLFQCIALTTREMMEVEGHLIAVALEDLVCRNFEVDWAALDPKKKKEIVLEGLYRGACAAPRENSRSSCPEMTVTGLAGDGEYNLINLLKRLIAHDPTGNNRVKELFLFTHPYPDHEFRHSEGAPDLLRSFLYRATLYHNFYILETLWGILEVYHGRPPKEIEYNENYSSHDRQKYQAEKDLHPRRRKFDKHQYKEQKANVPYGCYTCDLRTDNRDTLKRCARCQTVWYCSRECQRADWKTHKRFCGQQRFDPKLFTPEVKERDYFIGSPAVEPGFKRSPALWRQIEWLGEEDSQWCDYHVMCNHLDHTRSAAFRIFCPIARLVFLVARRRAMASGSVPAVYMMLQIMSSQIHQVNFSMEQVQRQLELDYGIEVAITPEHPTEQELDEEELYAQQREASAPIPYERLEPLYEGPGLWHVRTFHYPF